MESEIRVSAKIEISFFYRESEIQIFVTYYEVLIFSLSSEALSSALHLEYNSN